jgi:putative endonuclease
VAGYVYILASRRHGTLYIGVTTDLPKRIWEHRSGVVKGFTRRFEVKRLVYFETYHDVGDAIVRERRMKEWQRDWKVALIERDNPFWEDLAVTLLGFEPLAPRTPRGVKPMPSHPGGSRDPSTRCVRVRDRRLASSFIPGVHGPRLSPG